MQKMSKIIKKEVDIRFKKERNKNKNNKII